MIADAPQAQQAPQARPGYGPPPAASGYGAPPASGYGPPPASWSPPGSGQATVARQAPSVGGGNPQGTMILPDSQGVVAFAVQQAEAARFAAAQHAEPVAPAQPAHWSFWAAWVVLGIGTGLALHFWAVHNQLATAAAAAGAG